nr:hypothetical protein [Tanacetum cinerariifolium]
EKLMPNNGQAVYQLECSMMIGCLMYAMTCTRPDIAFASGNTEDNSSTSSWVFLLGGGAISWASKKQTCITSSIMKYKFMALAVAGVRHNMIRDLITNVVISIEFVSGLSEKVLFCSNLSDRTVHRFVFCESGLSDRKVTAVWIDIGLQGKDNVENILQPIDKGPFKMGKLKETLTNGAQGSERDRVFIDIIPEEKDRYKADVRVTNTLLEGLPKDIYTLINHYADAKDIWDNVKMLLEGSELTKVKRESQLYDAFEHFR